MSLKYKLPSGIVFSEKSGSANDAYYAAVLKCHVTDLIRPSVRPAVCSVRAFNTDA